MENKSEWNLGPDCLHPAKSYTSSRLDEAVKLRIDEKKLTINKNKSANLQKLPSMEPVSIFTRFKRTVELGPDKIALGGFKTHLK
jgi:hypothetical protein